MQTQNISDSHSISITQVRKDIDILMNLLDKQGEVNILKGRKILFKAVDPDFEAKRQTRIKRAVKNIRKFAKKHKPRPGEKPLSQWIIEERDRMQSPKYYE